MRATSASCPRRADARRPAAGFTLLELLVVLALGALVTGLVGPIAWRAVDAARERGVAADVSVMLAGLPMRAAQRGTPQQWAEADLQTLLPELPEGWRIEAPQPLRFAASGAAEGGEVLLVAPGRAPLRWRIEPITGTIDAPNDR